MSILANRAPVAEKVKFAYLMLDMDGDGKLSRADFSTALHSCFKENRLQLMCDEEALLDTMFSSRDPNSSISLSEFTTLLGTVPDINTHSLGFTKVRWMPTPGQSSQWGRSASIKQENMDALMKWHGTQDGQIASNVHDEDTMGTRHMPRGWRKAMRTWENHKHKWIVGILYFGGLAVLFTVTVWQYSQRTAVWKLFGPAVGISRGSAALLRVNCSLLLLLMCRNFM
jgi:hypothetical protein